MNVVKLSTCLSVTRAMIGIDRLNICLKQFTGGSQSHPRPLTTQQDTASLPVVAGVHTSKICAGQPPHRWPVQACSGRCRRTARLYLCNSGKQSTTWGKSYVISGCNFFSAKSQKCAFLWKFNPAFLNGPTASTSEGSEATGAQGELCGFFSFFFIHDDKQEAASVSNPISSCPSARCRQFKGTEAHHC